MPYKDSAKQREALRRWRSNSENRAKESTYPVDMRRKVEANARWNHANLACGRAATRRYKVRKLNASGDCSAEQMLARAAMFGFRCYLCGGPWEADDHVIPLSKGGTNWPSNLRPICKSCNSKKGSRRLAA